MNTTATPEVTEVPEETAEPTEVPTEAPTAPPAQSHTHSFDGGTVTTQPTCGAAGVKTYTCSCGETKTEAIAATGNHVNTREEWMYYPSCSKGGYVNVVCSDCGAWISGGDVPPTAHDFESTPGYAGDCSRPATFKNTCKECGAPGETTYGEKNPNVHNWLTVTGEEWDDEKQQWVEVTGTYCGWCGEYK